MVNLAVLACVLCIEDDDYKGRQLFEGKKCTPQKKILATPMLAKLTDILPTPPLICTEDQKVRNLATSVGVGRF